MAQITDKRPLPRHTRLDYDECYAKIVLELYFPNKYKDLIIADKPDLRTTDGAIGIEVTSAIPPKTQEAIALACEIPYLDEKSQNKRIAYLEKQGFKYGKYCMVHPKQCYEWTGNGHPEIEKTFCKEFISAVDKKLTKLNNGNYDLLSRYDLFIQADLYIEEWMPQELMNKLVEMSVQPLNYTFIFLLALNGLYVFDTSEHKHYYYETGRNLWGLGEIARNLVIKGECT